jgi:NADH-quinone oxidoreductase subunit L
MPEFLQTTPGFLFVIATLLPLASFLLVLLSFGMWCVCRPYRETEYGAVLYHLFGGDAPGRTPAYFALGAIVLAFVFSATGFTLFLVDYHKHENAIERKETEIAGFRSEAKHGKTPEDRKTAEEALEKTEADLTDVQETWNKKWAAQLDWIQVRPTGLSDAERGTVIHLGFRIDHLSGLMFVMVTFVASLIHVFSLGYMGDELAVVAEDHQVHTEDGHLHRRGRFGRFFLYLSLFCFSMLNLILTDNLFQIFLSWELVGICSYLLIGFYFERQSASNAANKAFIVNRVGDAGFIIGLIIIWTYVGSFNFEDVFRQVRWPASATAGEWTPAAKLVRATPQGEPTADGKQMFRVDPSGDQVILYPREPLREYHDTAPEAGKLVEVAAAPRKAEHGSMPYWVLVVAGLGVFLGCVGKSAQFPLQVWLPDAMEGPTPVSALIHAATMVAAGVYLVGRVYPLFTPDVLLVIAYVGATTLFVAATVAVVMTDIKKVLAYSTVSQLGYMMLALGVGGWSAGLFHLLTHAFFKALLFLGSGSVIYGCHHEQEMTKMGGLWKKMPITAVTMFVGVLAIAGMPTFSGWYSKDAVLASAIGFVTEHRAHTLLFVLPLVTAGITTFYMFRMWFMTFTGEPRDQHVYAHAHESPWTMTGPLIALGVLSWAVAWPAVNTTGSLDEVWPVWNAEASWVEHQLHHAQPAAVALNFAKEIQSSNQWQEVTGAAALGVVMVGLLFAALVYYWRKLDPAETKEQFAAVHNFLSHKWYFDELYSVLLVRPALVVSHWCQSVDVLGIDGVLHAIAHATKWVSWLEGKFDNGVIDGLVNLLGNSIYRAGTSLRGVQTGYLRSYVLFLVLAVVGIVIALSYVVMAAAAQ